MRLKILMPIIFFVGWQITFAQTNHWHFGEQGKKDVVQMVSTHPTGNIVDQRIEGARCPSNIDFENGDFSGWTCSIGSSLGVGNTDLVVFSGTTPVANRHTIIPRTGNIGVLDPYGQFPIVSPNGSNYSIRLGNSGTGAQAEKITYNLVVPTNQSDFNLVYDYAVVLNDGGHPTIQQPRFLVQIKDATTGALISSCASTNYSAGTLAGNGFFTSPVNSQVFFKPWTPVTIKLSQYAGRTINVEFSTYDCTVGGHFGYAYIDLNSNCSNLISGTSYCVGATSITLTAPPGFQNYTWWNPSFTTQLGTGQSLTISPPPATNSLIGVDLEPFPGFGCRDTAFSPITVSPKVFASFSMDTNHQCLGSNIFHFTSTSTQTDNGIPMHLWDFGNSQTSTLLNPSNTYLVDGNYTISLYVSDSSGTCKDTAIKTVIVDPNPSPNFTIVSKSRQCINGNLFTFTNTSTDPAGTPKFDWDFGDGSPHSTAALPTHTYTSSGTFIISLKVTGAAPGCATIMSQECNDRPNANS